jgi:hypothetical protein
MPRFSFIQDMRKSIERGQRLFASARFPTVRPGAVTLAFGRLGGGRAHPFGCKRSIGIKNYEQMKGKKKYG